MSLFRRKIVPSTSVEEVEIVVHTERVYLDHAGATPLSKRSKKMLCDTLSLYGNPSAIYKEGVEAKKALALAKKEIGVMLSCHPYEIYFVGTGTESVALAIMGTLLGWEANKENSHKRVHIITTEIEHPAVRELCKQLEKEGRIEVSYLPVDKEGRISSEQVKNALQKNTILISVMYVNNEIGSIMPIKEIGRMLSLYKQDIECEYPYFHTDACQAVNYLSLDVTSLRVDMMTVNSSKVYGPKGIALLYKKEGRKVEPVCLGGGQERGLRSGTEALPLILSFVEALKETRELRDAEAERLYEFITFTKTELEKALPSTQFYGSFEKEKRVANNINLRVPGMLSDEMILRLDALGFAVSHKSACASDDESMSYVLKALGATDEEANENIRVTLGRSTTRGDMMRFVEAVVEIAGKYVKRN